MKCKEFMAIAPMFASEDVTRPSLHTPFRHGNNLFVTDGRIALVCDANCLAAAEISEDINERQRDIGDRLLKSIETLKSKIDSGEYRGYGLCSIAEAVVAAFANVEPEMMWLRTNEPDEDDPDADGAPNSVRYVHEAFTAVIMANPARSLVAGYYASLISSLVKYHGPVAAYADLHDPHAPLYFSGDNWHCILMPRLVNARGNNFLWDYYGGGAIADAATGNLVWGREEDGNPDINALRAGGVK